MTAPVEFALLPTETLREHEEVVAADVHRMVRALRESGVVREPILVSREGRVILNGHHRYAALRELGAARIPAWIIPYEGDLVQLDRWSPGPPISKKEVLERAERGELFPPKTTRHHLLHPLPPHPTRLAELFAAAPPAARSEARPS